MSNELTEPTYGPEEMTITVTLTREKDQVIEIRIDSYGKPLPCNFVLRDFNYDPYETMQLDEDVVYSDLDGVQYACLQYKKGDVAHG